MKILLSKGKLLDFKLIDIDLCKDYIFSKQKSINLSKFCRPHKVEKLELVHMDMWGLSPVPSLESLLYYVTFIDYQKSKIYDIFRK